MEKNNKKANTLIKKRTLVEKIKKTGIRRTAPNSILVLEKYFKRKLEEIMEITKEKMIIQGRKTMKKTDVEKAIKELEKKENSWEI